MTNVLYIVSDDQRADMCVDYMPNLRRLLAVPGRVFTSCRTNIGWCQPSRVGFLTGLNHNHHGMVGAARIADLEWLARMLDGFDHDETVGRWLHAVGYRTGLIGKYLNTAPESPAGWVNAGYPSARPAGWDTWRQLTGGARAYSNIGYTVNADGVLVEPGEFQMDYLAQEAVAFVTGANLPQGASPEPWFCYLAPTGPHTDYAPAEDDLFGWSHVQWPIVDEDARGGVSDKPSWIQELPSVSAKSISTLQAQARGQLRELTAIDRALANVVGAIPGDVLARTVVIYSSDNGIHYGEHRRVGPSTKNTAYEASMRIPLIVRGPGFAPGVSNENVTVVDITRSIVRIASAEAQPPWALDGVDLGDVVANPGPYADRAILHAIAETLKFPYGEGLTTTTVRDSTVVPCKFFRYPNEAGSNRYESYYLDTDPDELENLGAGIAGFASLEASLDTLSAGTVPIVDEYGGGTGSVVTFNAPPVAGKTMIVVVYQVGDLGAPAGWAQAASIVGAPSDALSIWWLRATAGAVDTYVFPGGVQWYRYLVSNLTADPLDVTVSATSNGTATELHTGPFPQLAQHREFAVVAALQSGPNGAGESVDDKFTARDTDNVDGTDRLTVAERVTTAERDPSLGWVAATPDPTMSWTQARTAVAVGAAFKAVQAA